MMRITADPLRVRPEGATIITRIGWIGLGNMGGPMARNAAAAGFELTAFDLSPEFRDAAGVRTVDSPVEALRHADIVVTMLPKGVSTSAPRSSIPARSTYRPPAHSSSIARPSPSQTWPRLRNVTPGHRQACCCPGLPS